MCDYGHTERAGAAVVVIEPAGRVVGRDVVADLHTTEFSMMLMLMARTMTALPEGVDILFLTNAAYLLNFDKAPTARSANGDLILQCIEAKRRQRSVALKVVPYHKHRLLIDTHAAATEAMEQLYDDHHKAQRQPFGPSAARVTRMEQLYNDIRAAVDAGDKAQLASLQDGIDVLQAYYEGSEWRADFDADRRGFFPASLKRGMLAEGAIYDLLTDLDTVASD